MSHNGTGYFLFIFAVLLVLSMGCTDSGFKADRSHSSSLNSDSLQTFAVPAGQDFGLQNRCISTPKEPGSVNYYEDLSECTPRDSRWTVAVQSESDFAESCAGVNTQSLSINQGGPLSLDWFKKPASQGWSVELNSDFLNRSHPCGKEQFTWYALMDHVHHGGGPLPNPMALEFEADLLYNYSNPQGASRVVVAWQGHYDGSSVMVEINLHTTENWGDAHPEKDVIFRNRVPDENGNSFLFVNLDGRYLPDRLQIQPGVQGQVRISWANLLKMLAQRGLIPTPRQGWKAAETITVFVATETRNDSSTQAVQSQLQISNWKTWDLSSGAGSDSESEFDDSGDRSQSESDPKADEGESESGSGSGSSGGYQGDTKETLRWELVYRFYSHEQSNHMDSRDSLEVGEADGFEREGPRVEVLDQPVSNSHAVYRCLEKNKFNHFASVDPNCEGHVRENTLGYLFSAPDGNASQPVYRCYHPQSGDHMTTTNAQECRDNGYAVDWKLGYTR